MNQKIEELYWKSNKVHGDYSNGGVHVLDVEKFAELIIRECYKIAMKEGNGFYCPSDILDHFGVE